MNVSNNINNINMINDDNMSQKSKELFQNIKASQSKDKSQEESLINRLKQMKLH